MSVRVIQIGLGDWGRDWHRETGGLADLAFVGFVDTSPESLATAREQLGLEPSHCFTNLSEALEATSADAVLVTAPMAYHLRLAEQSLEAGLHVLVEKPFGPSVRTAEHVVRLAEQRGLVLAVSQNYRYYPSVATAQRLVHSGDLGRVGHVRVDFRKWANDRPPDTAHYRLAHALLYDMAVHHFDTMRVLLDDEAAEIYAKVVDPPWSRYDQEAAATVLVTFTGGVTVSYRGSWVSSGEPTPWSGLWHLECERGEIHWHGPELLQVAGTDPRGREHVRQRRPGETHAREMPTDAVPHRGRAGTMTAFLEAIRTGGTPAISGRDNLRTLALCEYAVRSAQLGQPVRIPELD